MIAQVKQISLVQSGLLFEYIDSHIYQYLYVNKKQSMDILNRNLSECQDSAIDDLDDQSILDLQSLVLKGYAIREYRAETGELCNKCEKLLLEINEDSNKDDIKHILSEARVFDIKNVVLFGDVFLYPDLQEILVFINNNGIFCNVQSECAGCENIKASTLRLINNIVIEEGMSKSQLHKRMQYFYNNNIAFGILEFDGCLELMQQYNIEKQDNMFSDNYMQIDDDGSIHVVQSANECNSDINTDDSLAQIWLNCVT